MGGGRGWGGSGEIPLLLARSRRATKGIAPVPLAAPTSASPSKGYLRWLCPPLSLSLSLSLSVSVSWGERYSGRTTIPFTGRAGDYYEPVYQIGGFCSRLVVNVITAEGEGERRGRGRRGELRTRGLCERGARLTRSRSAKCPLTTPALPLAQRPRAGFSSARKDEESRMEGPR
jgi:hypothetical protein